MTLSTWLGLKQMLLATTKKSAPRAKISAARHKLRRPCGRNEGDGTLVAVALVADLKTSAVPHTGAEPKTRADPAKHDAHQLAWLEKNDAYGNEDVAKSAPRAKVSVARHKLRRPCGSGEGDGALVAVTLVADLRTGVEPKTGAEQKVGADPAKHDAQHLAWLENNAACDNNDSCEINAARQS